MEIPIEFLIDSALLGNFNKFFPLLSINRKELTEVEKRRYIKAIKKIQLSILDKILIRIFKDELK